MPCDLGEVPMTVSIELEPGPDHWTLTLVGELDYGECSVLRMQVDRILQSSPPAVVVDMSGLDYLDSSGLGLLLSLSREYGAQGGRLVLVSNPTVDGILQMTRLHGIFTVSPSLAEAGDLISDTSLGSRAAASSAAGGSEAAAVS
jgi:anti-sigma B factor antagonist